MVSVAISASCFCIFVQAGKLTEHSIFDDPVGQFRCLNKPPGVKLKISMFLNIAESLIYAERVT